MEVAGIIALASSVVSLVNKIMDKSPSFSARERKKYNEKVKQFDAMVAMPKHERDHVAIMELWNELESDANNIINKL